jgi:hypothetical protein
LQSIYLVLPHGDYLASMREALSQISLRTRLEFSHEHARREGLDVEAPNKLWVQEDDSSLLFLVRPTIANEYEPEELSNIAAQMPPPHTFLAVDYNNEAFMLKVIAAVARLPAAGFGLVDDEGEALVPMSAFADKR